MERIRILLVQSEQSPGGQVIFSLVPIPKLGSIGNTTDHSLPTNGAFSEKLQSQAVCGEALALSLWGWTALPGALRKAQALGPAAHPQHTLLGSPLSAQKRG